jgi:hypothetical protein
VQAGGREAGPFRPEVLAPGRGARRSSGAVGDLAFDADPVAGVLGHPRGALPLHSCDVRFRLGHGHQPYGPVCGERGECGIEPLSTAPVGLMVGFSCHEPDQLVQVVVPGAACGWPSRDLSGSRWQPEKWDLADTRPAAGRPGPARPGEAPRTRLRPGRIRPLTHQPVTHQPRAASPVSRRVRRCRGCDGGRRVVITATVVPGRLRRRRSRAGPGRGPRAWPAAAPRAPWPCPR